MAFVRGMNLLLRDKQVAPRLVPIVADEARTFGMEGMFRQIGIYAPFGQKYKPVDADQLMYYREDQKGQVLQEGITEPGAMSAWMAAATSYSVSNVPMLPFYIYYSMFGFQRVGDLAWAAGDMRARGFLVGGTAGRTTLNGEGLQHEDGHSHLMAGGIPNCRAYDPTFSYEIAVILQDGMRRMLKEQEDVYYYITVMNENYAHPDMPKGAEADIIKGMYLLKDAHLGESRERQGQRQEHSVRAAARLRHDPARSDRGGRIARQGVRRRQRHLVVPELLRAAPRRLRRRTLESPASDGQDAAQGARDRDASRAAPGPAIAATDYVREYADQIRAFMPDGKRYVVLGTDGFGRSDTRANLRAFFEVDRYWIAHAAIAALAAEGKMNPGGCRARDQAVEARSGQAESADGLSHFPSPACGRGQGEGSWPDVSAAQDRSMLEIHGKRHRSQRIGWLRAAVLGANDGILSTASLIVGVAASSARSRRRVDRRHRRARRRRAVDGGRRIRFGQLAARHRACRSQARAP